MAPNSFFTVSTTLYSSGESSWMMWSVASRVAAAIRPVFGVVYVSVDTVADWERLTYDFSAVGIHDH
jgi:hypothetical protein